MNTATIVALVREAIRLIPDKKEASKIEASVDEIVPQLSHPVVDSVHKLARTIISLMGMGLGSYMALKGVPLETILATLAPAGIYNLMKGRGR